MTLMNTDLDRSVERLAKSEEYRARATGLGTTKQGQALARQCRESRAVKINAERNRGWDKALWLALKGINNDKLAMRLLVAGISVCGSDALGVDDDGEKNLREI